MWAAAILGLWAAEDPHTVAAPPAEAASEAPSPRSVGARLFDQLTSHDRVAAACSGAGGPSLAELVAAVHGSVLLRQAGALPDTFANALADPAPRPSDGLVWVRLGDDPVVGVHTTGTPAPLSLGDRWTSHWTESPRIRVHRDHTLTITPHGRTPAPTQARPEPALAAEPLPAEGCAAWSRVADHRGEPVERLVSIHKDHATMRVFAASARRSDARNRVETWAFAPATKRRPEAVMVVYTAPHVVAGAPWLQDSALPKRLSGLSTLIPSGYQTAPGQVRAWYDDVLGAAMAVVMPVVDAEGNPARVRTLLSDVRDRFGMPGEVEPEGRGGRLTGSGGVAIGAVPGALVLSTDPEVLIDILHGTGTEWTRPPNREGAVAGWWLARADAQPAAGATLSIEDQAWRVDSPHGLRGLTRATRWGEL